MFHFFSFASWKGEKNLKHLTFFSFPRSKRRKKKLDDNLFKGHETMLKTNNFIHDTGKMDLKAGCGSFSPSHTIPVSSS